MTSWWPGFSPADHSTLLLVWVVTSRTIVCAFPAVWAAWVVDAAAPALAGATEALGTLLASFATLPNAAVQTMQMTRPMIDSTTPAIVRPLFVALPLRTLAKPTP